VDAARDKIVAGVSTPRPSSADVWERNWQRVMPFFEFPEEIRKIIYTTNAVESHQALRQFTVRWPERIEQSSLKSKPFHLPRR
jgi:transposase-like protein